MTYLASWRGHFELLPYPPHPAEIFLRLTRTRRWLDLQLDRGPHLVVMEIPERYLAAGDSEGPPGNSNTPLDSHPANGPIMGRNWGTS